MAPTSTSIIRTSSTEYSVLDLLLLAGTQLCMAIEQWRNEHGAALRGWMDAWAEFEALNALANYAQENQDNTFPEFSDDEAGFEASALGHPLMLNETCVRNEVQLNGRTRSYVVSGVVLTSSPCGAGRQPGRAGPNRTA
jgi:DNA mismatch repair ATPase MutS